MDKRINVLTLDPITLGPHADCLSFNRGEPQRLVSHSQGLSIQVRGLYMLTIWLNNDLFFSSPKFFIWLTSFNSYYSSHVFLQRAKGIGLEKECP